MPLRKRCFCCRQVKLCKRYNGRWVCDLCLLEYKHEYETQEVLLPLSTKINKKSSASRQNYNE
jgi:hypothetical protein